MDLAAVRSKAIVFVVDSLFIVALIVCKSFVFGSCIASFAIFLLRKRERAACFTLIVFLVSCDCKCYVVLPHGTVGWFAVCDNYTYLMYYGTRTSVCLASSLLFIILLCQFTAYL